MIWDQLTSPQIAQLDKNIPVLILISATEQHGPHLPLATDRMIGEHIANTLNAAMPNEVLILPVVSVGCSTHHMNFAGSLTLTHDTFSQVVHDLVASVVHHGFHKILLLNSHGGNLGVGQVLVEQLGYKYPSADIAMATWWRIAGEALLKISESGFGGTGHACELETSLMLLIAPHLVVTELIARSINNPTFSWAEGDMLHGSTASYYRSMKQMTDNGVYGDPTYASAAKGQEITDVVIIALSKIVKELRANNKT